MKVYVGQTRSGNLIEELKSYGFGECVSRGELPPRRTPWLLDNGAFGDWKAGRPFDGEAFQRDIEKLRRSGTAQLPDFIVCPDIVAGGLGSLAFSLTWHQHLFRIAPLYLAVQDGMQEDDVLPHAERFAGLFVGGTLPWKIRSARRWVSFAHRHGLMAHVGRVGTERRAAWARRIGADSIDSCLPLWSRENLESFLRGLGPRHPELALGAA